MKHGATPGRAAFLTRSLSPPQGNTEDPVDKVDKIVHWPFYMCDEGCMGHEQGADALVMESHARNEAD